MGLFDCDIGSELYLALRDKEPNAALKTTIDSKFNTFAHLLDSKFLTEFPLKGNTHARIWELVMADILSEHQVQFSNPGTKKRGGADFKLVNNNKMVLVECATVNKPTKKQNPAKKHFDECDDISHLKVHRPESTYFAQRITYAIYEKLKQYKRWEKAGIVTGDEAWIIAVDTTSLPWLSNPLDLHSKAMSLLPIGQQKIDFTFDKQTGVNTASEPYAENHSFLEAGLTGQANIADAKNNDIFMSDQYSHLSAVVFSHHGFYRLMNYPNHNGLTMIHNPHAKNPLPLGETNWVEREYQVIKDSEWARVVPVEKVCSEV